MECCALQQLNPRPVAGGSGKPPVAPARDMRNPDLHVAL
jgi:hypothetical protein